MNRALSIVDLTGLDINDVKEIKELIESNFDPKKRELLEKKRFREKRAETYINKFKKLGKKMLKLNKISRKMTDNNSEEINELNILKDAESIKLYQEQSEKERLAKER